MKPLIAILLIFASASFVSAQAPAQVNYQAVARNSSGEIMANQPISVRLSIHDASATGTVVYSEQRSVTTNASGLFNYAIGSAGATNTTGSMGTINWGGGPKFLQVEIDPAGGSNFTTAGTSQLLSVPYSLFSTAAIPSGAAGGSLSGNYPNPDVARIRGINVSATAPTANQVLQFNGTNWIPAASSWVLNGNNITNTNSGNVGIKTTTPDLTLHLKQDIANRAIKWEHESTTESWSVGIGTNTKNCRFEYTGLLRGQISSVDGAYIAGSDRTLKEDIQPISQLLDKVMQLKTYSYFYKDSRSRATHKSLGFIAQDVEQLFPELVYAFDGGLKGLNYAGFSVLAIKAIQEMKPIIDEQDAKIKALEERLANVEALIGSRR